MSDDTFLTTEMHDGILQAVVRCEKITERESTIIESGLTNAATEGSWKITLDLASVMLLASVGLGLLINLDRGAKEKGGGLVIHGLPAPVFEMLKITKLHRVLTIVSDHDAAVKKFR